MLNEDRIRVMTRLAAFEKEHAKENESASRFYKGDYISYNMIWAGIMATIAFLCGLGIFFFLNFDTYMANMHKMDLFGQGKIIIMLYIVFLAAVLTISYFIYRKRYLTAQKRLNEYCGMLHDLERIYNNERHREYTNQGRRVDRR